MSEYKAIVKAEIDQASLNKADKDIKNIGKDAKVKVAVDVDSKASKAGKTLGEEIGKQVKSGVSSSKIGEEINSQVSTGVGNLSKLNTTGNTTSGVFSRIGNSIKTAFANFTGVGAITAGFYEVKQAAQAAKESIEEINKATVELQMATNQSYENVGKMVGSYNKMGQELGATTTEVATSADEWLRQGKSISETNALIKDSMVLSKVANIDSADSTAYLTSAIKGYNVEVANTMGIVDKLTSVDLVSATDAGGLAEGMSRTANSANQAGVSMDKLLGYLATVGEVTQKSMSSVGESFKSIFARMSDIKAGKLASVGDDGSVEDISNVEVVLKALDIKLRDSNQEFRNFGDVLDEVGGKWNGFSSLQQAAISKAFAGTRQAENFKVLMANYKSASSYAETAANSEGQALEKFNYYADSIEAKKKSLQASFESLATNTFSSETYGVILDTTKAVIDFTNQAGILKGALAGLAVAGVVKGFTAIQSGIIKSATQLTNFNDALDLVKKGGVVGDEFDKLQILTGGLTKKQADLVISSQNLSREQKLCMMTARGMSEAEAEIAISSTAANKSTATLSSTIKGLGSKLIAMTPILGAIAAAYAAFKLADAIRLDYEEAQEGYQTKKSKYDNTLSELNSLKSEQENVKASLQDLANEYNVTFDQTDTLDTMISKLQKLNMTLEDKSSLELLTQKTGELERQVDIQTQLAEIQQKSAATAAKVASETTDFNESAMRAEMISKYGSDVGGLGASVKSKGEDWLGENGKIGQVLNLPEHLGELISSKLGLGDIGNSALTKYFSNFGNIFGGNIGDALGKIKAVSNLFKDDGLLGLGKYQEKDADALKTNLDLVSDYSKKIQELQAEKQSVLNNDNYSNKKKQKEYDKLEADIQNYTDAMAIAEQGLSEKSDTLIEERASMVDQTTGATLKGYETQVKSIDAVLAKMSGKELSGYQKQLADIQGFFDGSDSKNSLSNYLTDIAKANGDVESAMKSLGISSSSFNGTDLSAVAEYFNDIAKNAEDAANAVADVDGTIDGVGTAIESVNGGENFTKMKDYMDQADKLLSQGLTGTDDFRSVEKMITQGTGKSYQDARESLNRYFTTDQNEESEFYGQLTRDGVQNFVDDFQNLGAQFKTTGEAAKAMGLSTEVFEACMGRISDYNGDEGFEGVKNSFKDMEKTSVQLSDAKAQLQGLQDVYDSMDAGDDKDRLKINLDNWSSQIEQAEADMSSLPDAVVTQLKFEYDKTQLEKANEEMRSSSGSASDSTKRDTYASILASDDKIISDTEGSVGNDIVVAVQADTGNYDEAIADAQRELDDLVASGADDNVVVEAQMKLDNAKQQYVEALEDMSRDGQIQIDAEVDDSTIRDKIDSLEEGQSIEFSANVDGVISQVEAIKNEDGSISYTGNVDGVETTLYAIKNEDGTVTYSATYQESAPPKKDGIVDYLSKFLSANAPGLDGIVKYLASFANIGAPPVLSGVINYVKHIIGGSEASGTAHLAGTAFASGVINGTIPKNVFSDEKYRTAKDQIALTGELGQELVVNAKTNSWRLVGGNGAEFAHIDSNSIIFNHKQTNELLKNGFTNSRGKAKVGGTAYASGGVVGNITDINRPSREKGENEFNEIFDHVEILLDRIDRQVENLKDSIDDYSDNISKQNAVTQDAINATRNNISQLQSAYDTYMSQANAVGLEGNWAAVVQGGELRISDITDEDLKQRLEDYQKYFELANDCQDKILDAQRDLLELATQKLENIENYYQNRADYNEDFGYAEDIGELKKALDEYRNELSNQMDAGIIKQFSQEWYDAQFVIAEKIQEVLEATWNRLEYVVDGLDRLGSKLDNISSLEDARGNTLKEDDYQKQIENNNKSIEAQYALRNSYMSQMAIYDVDSKQYQDLAEKISDCDDEIYNLLEDNEELKDSIWGLRFTEPLEKLKDGYEEVIKKADDFRNLMNDDSFVAKDGSLTSNGLANIAMIMQGMNASKQITADYTEALKKLDDALKNNIISQSEYDEQQQDILDTINESVGTTEDYKNELVSMYEDISRAEVESQEKRIDKQKEYMSIQRDAYEYSKKLQQQSKNLNQLKAKEAALMGVSNASSMAELKRIQQEIANQEQELSDTKKDHEYTLRVEGLDNISDSLSETLENTIDEITYNAEKQESIVKEMLGHVVDAYDKAYGTINGIINNTGFQFGYDNSANNSNLGTSTGAKDQYESAIKNPSDVSAGGTVTDISTDKINDNTTISGIENDIKKPIDTTNRKVAELTLSKTSLSIQEGGTGSLTVGIRPTDAKNKTVIWTTSDPSIATVSNGSVKAIKPGSATIVVATTDGSGLSVSCGVSVTKKPDPPKPTPAPSSGGDGNPRVGDVVTLKAGQKYYYSSWGTRPSGNMFAGVKNGVKINAYSGKEYGGNAKYHGDYGVSLSSADGKYQLGWVRLDQLEGYASGTRNATAGLHRVDELGNEATFHRLEFNGKHYQMFNSGDKAMTADMTDNLFSWGGINPQDFVLDHLDLSIPKIPEFTVKPSIGDVNIKYDSLINVEGNVDKDVLPELEKLADSIVDKSVTKMKAETIRSYNKHR